MTGALGNTRKDALDIRRRAGEWLVARNASDSWSEIDQQSLDQWLAESPGHLIAYWRLEAAWTRAQRLSAVRGTAGAAPDHARGRNWFALLRVPAAAAVAILVGLGAMAYLRGSISHTPVMQSFATGIGGHKILKLADGTKIELTTSTAVRLAIGVKREIWLDRGEAFFEVAHDPAHPFILNVRGQRIVDIGTKFLVHRKDDGVDIMVADGEVRIESSAAHPQHEPVLLKADEAAIVSADSVAVVKKSPEEIENELAWRRGVLIFDEATLREVAGEFNRYNTTKLVIADEKTADLSVGGTFPASGVESFVRVAQHILKLHVEKRGESIVLSR
jgi:transmembrane sensor